MNVIKQAKKIRADIDTVITAATDEAASKAASLYPKLKQDGTLVKVGTRINWNGQLKKATVDVWDTESNNPDNSPTLWADLNYKDGYRIIPEVITVATAFSLGECGWWNDVLYKSNIDSNVWTPTAYAAGWETVI
jgi:hypothetical protein